MSPTGDVPGGSSCCPFSSLPASARAGGGARPLVRGTLIRLEVERLPRPTNAPIPLWFWWNGPTPPDLAEIWRAYITRFSIEHTCCFFKQTLRWTMPKRRSPAAADRWTWLLILAYVQLRLARDAVDDVRLPWQPPLPPSAARPHGSAAAFRTCSHAWAAPQRAKTLRSVAGTSHRQALTACSTLPGGQIDALIHLTLWLFDDVPAIVLVADHLLLVKV